MEIPLNAQVECTDGVCGRSAYVLINPVLDEVTHLVVREGLSPSKEYIVPLEFVRETIAQTIQLSFARAELEKMEPFIKTTFIEVTVPERNYGYGSGMGPAYYLPYVTSEITVYEPVNIKQTPLGELALRRGTRVEASDGYVGHIDEFVVNSENGHLTHMILREGHLLGQKDVIIPLSAICETHENTVSLNLDKHQVEALPTFPVHRRWS